MPKRQSTRTHFDNLPGGATSRPGKHLESQSHAGQAAAPRLIKQGVFIFQSGDLVFANPVAVEMTGYDPQDIYTLTLATFFGLVNAADSLRLQQTLEKVQSGEIGPLQPEVCFLRPDGSSCWVDMLLNQIYYQGLPALQVNALDISQRRAAEESLELHTRRLQILREIAQTALAAQDEQACARAALRRMHTIVPDYRASSVVLIDQTGGEAYLLALDFNRRLVDWELRKTYQMDELSVDLAELEEGHAYVVDDLGSIARLTALQRDMLELGISSYLAVPLLLGNKLIGSLNLASASRRAFAPHHAEIAQDLANALAIAIQQARLRQAEQQRRQEAEIMQDVMASLASVASMNQSLEIILVNLRNVVEYDRAGLFLLDESNHYVLTEKSGVREDFNPAMHQATDPLVEEFRRTKRPIVVQDIQADARFDNWTDMQSLRAWMGAPLIVGSDVIGFLSLGSLEPGTFSGEDAALARAFTSQVAEVLERARLQDVTDRHTEELEVLSSITVALGQAETSESTLSTLMDLVTSFLGAGRGVFLFPDKTKTQLVGKLNLDGVAFGLGHPYGDDLLWRVYNFGQAAVITDVRPYYQSHQPEVFRLLFQGMQSAALLPLISDQATFGILCFTFETRRSFSAEDIKLYNAIAEIAGTSLRRAVVLEGLEKQVEIRTQHLSTLYHINAVASEKLDFQVILDQVLKITLDAMKSASGMIHLANNNGKDLTLVAQQGLPLEMLMELEKADLEQGFWREALASSNPLVIPDLRADGRLPESITRYSPDHLRTYLSTPIRAKGQPLGLLSIFGQMIQDYTIEDITLLMTIADQIGISVERARLIKQAEQAAVVEERQRLARELHDSVTQLLYSQVLFAGAGLKVLNQGNLELIHQHLTRINQAALQALKEMRLLVYELRPSDYLEEGLVGALQRRLDSVEKRTGMNARLTVSGDLNLDESTEMALYRITQEALNNTLKYAGATSVSVEIRAVPGRVELEVADNGCGFDVQQKRTGGGMGLSIMEERTAAMRGSLHILSKPGEGTRVKAIIEEPK